MDSAVFLYNKYSDLSKHIEVYYSTGVPTAEASSNGDLRFGKDRNYMFVGTAMHEMAHTMGMGTTSDYQRMFKDGVFQGEKAQKVIKEIDGPDAVLKGDSQHFWPYGLNYKSEVHSEQDLINHVKVVNAMYQDIFKEAFYMQGRVVSLVDEKTCMGITSSNALELMSCTDSATFVKIYSIGDNPVTYRIQLGNRVVDIPNESTAEGVVASTYGYNGGAHQRYVFEKAGAPRANMTNVYFLKNFKSGLYLQAVGKNVVQNKFVRSASSIPQSDFIWQIVEAGKDTSSKDTPVSISTRKVPNRNTNLSVPARLFDALGRAAGEIRRGVTSRILKSN
ncbi:MAG: RICIN domain-containing protein [Fibrobacter sp.]|nr:RICIN domain-containing protein [Fibrobacter sp.]